MAKVKFLIPLFLIIAASAVAEPSKISEAQARLLVLKMLQSEGYKTTTPTFELERINDPLFPDYYLFGASVNNGERLDTAGEYVVDPRTADLQEMNICVQPKARTVRAFQAQLRKSINLFDSERLRLQRQHPLPCFK